MDVKVCLVFRGVEDYVVGQEHVLVVHKRQSNKMFEDMASHGEVLTIKPVSEPFMRIANPLQDGLAEMEEASLAGYIQTKYLVKRGALTRIKVNTDFKVIHWAMAPWRGLICAGAALGGGSFRGIWDWQGIQSGAQHIKSDNVT